MNKGIFSGPIFIIGMPRSGTKLLRGLLNQHPLIGISPSESEFLPWLIQNWLRFGKLSNRNSFRKFYNEIINIHYFQRINEEKGVIAEDTWYNLCLTYTPAGIFEALIRHDVGISPKEIGIWGDKSPSYIGHITLLKELFPDARFIYIVRDVRDYCLSIRKAWGKSMLRAAQRWADCVGIAEESRQLYPKDFIGLRYEDLLDNTERELRRICAFLEVRYYETMASLRHSVENLGDAKGMAKIRNNNQQKYSTEMNMLTCKIIERLCWPMLKSWGYPYNYSGPVKRIPLSALKMLQVYDALNLFRFHISERGISQGVSVALRLYSTSGNRL